MRDSNPRPIECKSTALPLRQSPKAGVVGFEPTVLRLTVVCITVMLHANVYVRLFKSQAE